MIGETTHTHTVEGLGIPTVGEWTDLFLNLSGDFPGASMKYVSVHPQAEHPHFSVTIEY